MSKISLKEKWLVDVPKLRKDIKSCIKIDPKSLKIGPWGSLGGVWGSNWDLLGGGGGGSPPKKAKKWSKGMFGDACKASQSEVLMGS